MPLSLCTDVDAAGWIAHSGLPWQQLVCFGPAGFAAYARLRLLPDPSHPGQSENDAEAEDWRSGQMPILFEVLAGHTATADDCYVCVWDGWSHPDPITHDDAGHADPAPADSRINAATARPGLAPDGGVLPAHSTVAKVVVPHREYWLFRGPLTCLADTARPERHRFDEEQPAFVWPADRGWCFAQDVDPHWAGIGGSSRLIDQLVADPRLDVVPADPSAPQPTYR